MKFCFCLILAASVGVSSAALATLGEAESSVVQNLQAFHAASDTISTMTQGQELKVHQMQVQANTIKQYADSDGTIFAVTWKGPSMPPLSVLMGRYFPEYNLALAANIKVRGNRHLNITTPSLQVMQQGPLMHLHGVAYLLGKVPAGVEVENLP